MASIVGFSGSGKSTSVSLLIRIHDPDEGCIIVNGHDVREYDPVDYYKHIAMLFQTTSKTTTTGAFFFSCFRRIQFTCIISSPDLNV
jgi:ABC-type multidrug transport system fused ATPase/permease subunit